MGLAKKFSLVLIAAVLGASLCITIALSRLSAQELTSYLFDLQTSAAIAHKREMDTELSAFYHELTALLSTNNFQLARWCSRQREILHGELWVNGVMKASCGVPTQHPVPPEKVTDTWKLAPPTLSKGASLRWIAGFGNETFAFELKDSWLKSILNSFYGSVSYLVSKDGKVIFVSDTNADADQKKPVFHNPAILKKVVDHPFPAAITHTYTSNAGIGYVGTFLALNKTATYTLVIETATSKISSALYPLYVQSAMIAGIFLLIAIGMGVLTTSRITSSLKKLTRTITEIAAGNYDSKAKIKPSRDEIGTLTKTFNHMIDEINKAREEAIRNERLAALGRFSASLAHELKNPLANISSNAQVIELKVNPEQRNTFGIQKSLTYIRDEVKRASTIISNLMKFSREDKKPTRVLDLNATIDKTYGLLESLAAQKQVEFQLDKKSKEAFIMGEDDQVYEVITNLVQNAFYAVKDVTGKKVTLSFAKENDKAVITIKDNGCGMPPEVQKRLFEPFFTTKPIGEGTGIGLSVCHGIIRTLGGRIVVESEPNKGTSFIITLPLVENTSSTSRRAIAA